MSTFVTTEGKKINWFDITAITYKKEDPFLLFLKLKDDRSKQHEVNLEKKDITKQMLVDASFGSTKHNRKISKAKYDDLMKLLRYIPQKYHNFYQSLEHDGEIDVNADCGLVTDCYESDTD